jgi:hypothetical protein
MIAASTPSINVSSRVEIRTGYDFPYLRSSATAPVPDRETTRVENRPLTLAVVLIRHEIRGSLVL